MPAEVLVASAREWVETAQVSMLGGCCGVGPEHIVALAGLCAETRRAAHHNPQEC